MYRQSVRSVLSRCFMTLAACCCLSSCAPPTRNVDLVPEGVSVENVSTFRKAQESFDFFNRGRYTEAAMGFHHVLVQNPNARNTRISLAATYERLGLHEEALSIYDSLLAEKPDEGPVLAGRAKALATAGRWSEAIDSYDKALIAFLTSNSTAVAASQAQSASALAFRIGDEEGALCYAAQARSISPSKAQTLRFIRLLLAAGRISEAQRTMGPISDDLSTRSDAEALLLLAQVSFADGQFTDALSFVVRSLQAAPKDPQDAQEITMFRNVAEEVNSFLEQNPKAPKTLSTFEPVSEEPIALDPSFAFLRAQYWPASAQGVLLQLMGIGRS